MNESWDSDKELYGGSCVIDEGKGKQHKQLSIELSIAHVVLTKEQKYQYLFHNDTHHAW